MSRSPKLPPRAAQPPLAATAIALLDACAPASAMTIYAAASERRARDLADLLATLQPGLALAWYPPWDTLPYDRLAPSAATQGQRMGVLRWLTDAAAPPRLVVTTAEALAVRVPPRSVWPAAHLSFTVGEAIDPAAVRERLLAVGYLEDDLVDQPGECAVRGQVVDIFPAAAPLPCRIVFENGRIVGIRSYHPLTQHTEAESDELVVDPATEAMGDEPCETLFDYAPQARLILDSDCSARLAAMFDQIDEAAASPSLAAQARRYVARDQWNELQARHLDPKGLALPQHQPAPAFARMKDAGRAFDTFVLARHEAGDRIVVAGPRQSTDPLLRRIRRVLPKPAETVEGWDAVRGARGDAVLRLDAPLEAGLVIEDQDITLLAAADLLGSRATPAGASAAAPAFVDTQLRIGDVVVHRDHGLAVLEALETVAVPGESVQDFLRLRYADDARQMLPAADVGLLWRYGSEPEAVTLDRLDRDSWARRRDKVVADVARTATALVALARERQAREAPAIAPPADLYERFSARFPFTPTPDQAAAIDAVLADLASGRPMDRLVCGDVGYGKTEVALRAAAAVAFSGRQVAVLAPTTLLARQHLRSFRRRFAGLGIEVGELSRVVDAATARSTRKGLKDGSIRVVVGTQAICAASVSFQDLGLVVVDEEQKFGARHKAQVRALAETAHALTMTATPIPRTLQASLVGLQDLSVIATPPFLRQPVRTAVATPDRGLVRDALTREKRRGGQSFFVCPRVADIEPARAFLRDAVPELSVRIAHGQMKPAEMDAEMLAFAEGDGDVLLATSIIESGVDVPGANTLFVWDAGRFGMAQLHQLRGRVGRGARRAFVTFLTPEGATWKQAEKRLRALESLDRLGAGFAISARDLDLRGAGDLLGDEQAGHVKLIGVGLYQELLGHAMARARGEEVSDAPPPELNLGLDARIPADYVPEAEMRLALYAALRALPDLAAFDAFELSLADRFGPPPSAVLALLAAARLRMSARELGIRRLDAGAQGMAATFAPGRLKPFDTGTSGWTVTREKIAAPVGSSDPDERLMLAENFLEEIRAIFEAAEPLARPREVTASSM